MASQDVPKRNLVQLVAVVAEKVVLGDNLLPSRVFQRRLLSGICLVLVRAKLVTRARQISARTPLIGGA